MDGFLDKLLKPMGKDRAWLSRMTEVDQATLSRINNGHGGTYPTLRKLAPFLGYSAGQLAEMLELFKAQLVA